MAKYIDADKFYNELDRMQTKRKECTVDYLDVFELLDKQPTADVEEVCRCKICGYSEQMNSLYCHYFNKNVDEDDFCSQGG